MDYEHHLVAPIGDKLLQTQVSQGYNIGDAFFTESHTIVVAIQRVLAGHCNRAAIFLQPHFSFWLSGILH